MALSSRMIWELHCDATGCGSVISGSSAPQVEDHAFGAASWERVTFAAGHGDVKILVYCGLHRPAQQP